mmetsp:Transcript_60064/g.178099  ORF Transcript_60064/g.178099 Transcript_60064/m.178099 type:complete len:316 (-) Transcript_60064:822-1769(-)
MAWPARRRGTGAPQSDGGAKELRRQGGVGIAHPSDASAPHGEEAKPPRREGGRRGQMIAIVVVAAVIVLVLTSARNHDCSLEQESSPAASDEVGEDINDDSRRAVAGEEVKEVVGDAISVFEAKEEVHYRFAQVKLSQKLFLLEIGGFIAPPPSSTGGCAKHIVPPGSSQPWHWNRAAFPPAVTTSFALVVLPSPASPARRDDPKEASHEVVVQVHRAQLASCPLRHGERGRADAHGLPANCAPSSSSLRAARSCHGCSLVQPHSVVVVIGPQDLPGGPGFERHATLSADVGSARGDVREAGVLPARGEAPAPSR